MTSTASHAWTIRSRQWLCLVVTLLMQHVASAQIPGEEPNGLVYFAGTVQTIIQGAAVIDLGDVHTLQPGHKLAVFRTKDSYLRPLGTIEVTQSHPNWFHTDRNSSHHLRQGDLVLFVRTVAEVGTPETNQRQFLANRYLKSRGRNSYSTVNDLDVAMALRKVSEGQPVWIRERRRVAGLVTGESLDSSAEERLQLLTQQINQIRRLAELGVPAEEAAGPRWQSVMTVLKGPEYVVEKLGTTTEDEDNFVGGDPVEDVPIPADRVRGVVQANLFTRAEEEQNVISLIVSAMMQLQVGDESLWLRRQLLESQFPRLANDEQIYFDVDRITRVLRNTE